MGRTPARESIQTELGEEIKCAHCGEFWPSDPEFFYFSNGRPHSYCKACYLNHPTVFAKRQREVERLRAARLACKPKPSDSEGAAA